MPQINIFTILAVFIAIGAIYLIGMLLFLPVKLILKFVVNGLIGAVLLFIINIFGNIFGITIAINPITALVAGLLGIPGVVLLLILQYIL